MRAIHGGAGPRRALDWINGSWLGSAAKETGSTVKALQGCGRIRRAISGPVICGAAAFATLVLAPVASGAARDHHPRGHCTAAAADSQHRSGHHCQGHQPSSPAVIAPAAAPAPAPVAPKGSVLIGHPTPLTAPRPPVIADASQSHRSWREGATLARVSRTGPPLGTTFSFSLSEHASVTFTFAQQLMGRRVSGRCVAQTHSNEHMASCRRYLTRGALRFSGHAGMSHVAFQGRISRTSRLPSGSYTLTISAVNAAHQRAAPRHLGFDIVH